jgi:hypothetical protein
MARAVVLWVGLATAHISTQVNPTSFSPKRATLIADLGQRLAQQCRLHVAGQPSSRGRCSGRHSGPS